MYINILLNEAKQGHTYKLIVRGALNRGHLEIPMIIDSLLMFLSIADGRLRSACELRKQLRRGVDRVVVAPGGCRLGSGILGARHAQLRADGGHGPGGRDA